MSVIAEFAKPVTLKIHLDGVPPLIIACAAQLPKAVRLAIAANALATACERHRGGALTMQDRNAIVLAMLLLDACLGAAQVPKQSAGTVAARVVAAD